MSCFANVAKILSAILFMRNAGSQFPAYDLLLHCTVAVPTNENNLCISKNLLTTTIMSLPAGRKPHFRYEDPRPLWKPRDFYIRDVHRRQLSTEIVWEKGVFIDLTGEQARIVCMETGLSSLSLSENLQNANSMESHIEGTPVPKSKKYKSDLCHSNTSFHMQLRSISKSSRSLIPDIQG